LATQHGIAEHVFRLLDRLSGSVTIRGIAVDDRMGVALLGFLASGTCLQFGRFGKGLCFGCLALQLGRFGRGTLRLFGVIDGLNGLGGHGWISYAASSGRS